MIQPCFCIKLKENDKKKVKLPYIGYIVSISFYNKIMSNEQTTKGNETMNKLNIIIKKNRSNKEVAFKIVRSCGQLLKRRMKLNDAYFMLANGSARIAKDF